MLHEVRVRTNHDVKEKELLHEIQKTLGIHSITKIVPVKVYRIEGLNEVSVKKFATTALTEKINQEYTINSPLIKDATKSVEVIGKPGVMNPEVTSLLKTANDLGFKDLAAAETSWEYHFYGTVSKEKLQSIVDSLLVNKTVQQLLKNPPKTLLIKSDTKEIKTVSIKNKNDDELLEFAKKNQLYLNLEELKTIQNFFIRLDRNPIDAELETIAQTWSEHCSHKTFKARLLVDGKEKEPLFTRLEKAAYCYMDNVVSAFIDNAGAFRFYDGYAILGKVETHNSPSAIEPYGGAATGSGGVFRDIMGTGKGAKVIASTDMFCFGSPNLLKDEVPPGCLHPNYLLRRVVAGVRDYGNRMGIPTNNGSVHFHDDFRAKPTVIVGAYGIAREEYCKKGSPKIGDKIFVVGGKTGRDGIHGATFSSGQMHASTISENASAVQIGNPIEQKRMADALLVCRDKGLIRAITDCGAGGLSSAVGEMGSELGVKVELDQVPLKYAGLAPWEIWISESQERMVCAVAPEHIKKFIETCKQFNVPATNIGEFTGEKKLMVTYKEKLVTDLSMDFLHKGMPRRLMIATKPKQKIDTKKEIPKPADWTKLFINVLSHWNICSKESIVRQYDHGVQGTNVLPPFSGHKMEGPNDAVVLAPLLGKKYGLIISHGMNPILNSIDPYQGSLWAITEALSNLVAVGGNPQEAALIDNFIWPYPDEESLWQLDQALDACADATHSFKIPFISGKDSLSSTYRYQTGEVLKIPPVLCVSVFGKIPNISKTITADFKEQGSLIVLIGNPEFQSMGGSIYAQLQKDQNINLGSVPNIKIDQLRSQFSTLHNLISQGEILSCHDISEGGIAVALSEMCFGGNVGADIDLSVLGTQRPDYLLFNETAGCFLIEISEYNFARNILSNLAYQVLGKTINENKIIVNYENQLLVSAQIDMLRNAWQKPMKEIFSS